MSEESRSLNTLEPPKPPKEKGWIVSAYACYLAPHPDQAADWFRDILASDSIDDFVDIDVVDEHGRRESFTLHPAEHVVPHGAAPKKTLTQDGYSQRPNSQFFMALAEALVEPDDEPEGIKDHYDAAVSGLKQLMVGGPTEVIVWWKVETKNPERFENEREHPVITLVRTALILKQQLEKGGL